MRSFLVLAGLALALAASHEVHEPADMEAQQMDLSESTESTDAWGRRRRFGDSRRRRTHYERRRRRSYYCGAAKNADWSGYGNWGGHSAWGDWSGCHANGYKYRYRSMTRYRGCLHNARCGGSNTCTGTNSNGGSESSSKNERFSTSWGGWGNWSQWGGWGDWNACNSHGYSYAYRIRYRSASCPKAGECQNWQYNAKCPSEGTKTSGQSNSRSWNRKVNCSMNAWTGWTACSKSCGTGTQSRSRTVATEPSCSGYACPTDLTGSQDCNTHACPVDCVVPNFDGPYTACTKSCGGGSQHRTRSLTAPMHGGRACPASITTRSCGNGPCPIHCATSAFNAWTTCTKSCGTGAQSRSRTITNINRHGGYVCPYLQETRNCNQQACAVNCIVGGWRAWGTCSKSCATGSQSRGRTNTPPTFGGDACPTTNSQTRACNTFVCPINGGWSAFTSCTQFCGSGSQSRTCTNPAPAHGGANCPGSPTGVCNTAACPKAPKCFVTASGETRVEYTDSKVPSFKCSHTATKCTCTAGGHPTHHKGGCQQLDHTNGKTLSFAGDCTSTGRN